jgi:hypothetical protein
MMTCSFETKIGGGKLLIRPQFGKLRQRGISYPIPRPGARHHGNLFSVAFGFSHTRRATPEKVDLNRNFHDFSRPLRRILRREGARARRIGWIDLHTGLGKQGACERGFAGRADDDAAYARAQAWWGGAPRPSAGSGRATRSRRRSRA